MATLSETRRPRASAQQPEVDVRLIIAEAQTRWLRPVEVCEILKNYAKYGFKLNPVPPVRPVSGSMFLFDRKTLRYFRKDGHNWRKKKDGKTVREAHERLKTGSVDVLHCYYAHGEDRQSFQRRCYWMLDPALEHIVLVHYREVTEATRFTMNESHSASAVHAASPPEVSNPSTSPEVEHEDGDAAESEDVDEHTSLESVANASSPQHTLLDQISPRLQGGIDSRGNSPVNSWMGLDLRGGSSSSNSWLTSSVGGANSSLLGIERMLESPTGLTPGPAPYYAQPSNRHHLSPLSNNQFSGELPGSMKESPSLGASGYTNILSQDTFLGGRQQIQSGSLDVTGWNQVMESSQMNNPPFGSGNMGGPSATQSGGGAGNSFVAQSGSTPPVAPSVYVKQESMNGATWADMLEQCTTPSTLRNMMDSLTSNSQLEVNEPSSLQDIFSSQIPSSKGILDALSPRGLGREPQTPLEASLRAVTQDKAIRSATDGYQRRFLPGRSDSQPLDLQWEQKSTEVGYSKFENIKVPENEGFAKLDSFNRWMTNLSDGQSFLSPGPPQYGWPSTPTIEGHGLGGDIYSISHQMQVETGLSTSVSSDQRFSILDFSPEWAYASEGSKVLITGTFLGDYVKASNFKWCCMFGEVEVPAEYLGGGVLRCNAPSHSVGRFPFYVTCGDRQSHSEIREFEYRSGGRVLTGTKEEIQAAEERLLKIRLARMLLADSDAYGTFSSTGPTMKQLNYVNSFSSYYTDDEWVELESLAKNSGNLQDFSFQDRLLQMLLKARLQKWLLSKIQDEDKGASVHDAQGQGVLHMAAALGYDWVVAPMVAAGVPINFRDVHGWTALHWAASYGKEQVVVALLGAEADPGTVTDPTPSCPAGQTPAELASMNGHVGIGGFLAENSLTRRLSNMTLAENPLDIAMSHAAAENAVAMLARRESIKRSVHGAEDQLAITESLQAVRNAARAAALIQAAFRQHSFRKREEDDFTSMQFDEYGMSQSQLRNLLARRAAQRIQRAYRGHQEKKQHLAASRIQQKFRSWKIRRDFLNFRQRVVKLQAHVRGNLVRKRFKKLLWSVGILEKAVLRWRRKRSGLRGYKSGDFIGAGKEDDEEFLKEGRKQTEVALEKAVTTVQSMVRSHDGRQQYRRLREGSLKAERLGQYILPADSRNFSQEFSQDFSSGTNDQFQGYNQDQSPESFLDTADDQLMNYSDQL